MSIEMVQKTHLKKTSSMLHENLNILAKNKKHQGTFVFSCMFLYLILIFESEFDF